VRDNLYKQWQPEAKVGDWVFFEDVYDNSTIIMAFTFDDWLPTYEELDVQEVRMSAAPLRAGAYHFGKYCDNHCKVSTNCCPGVWLNTAKDWKGTFWAKLQEIGTNWNQWCLIFQCGPRFFKTRSSTSVYFVPAWYSLIIDLHCLNFWFKT